MHSVCYGNVSSKASSAAMMPLKRKMWNCSGNQVSQHSLEVDPDLPWLPQLHLKQGYLYVSGFLFNSKCLKYC